jgi:hypothetical protein
MHCRMISHSDHSARGQQRKQGKLCTQREIPSLFSAGEREMIVMMRLMMMVMQERWCTQGM